MNATPVTPSAVRWRWFAVAAVVVSALGVGVWWYFGRAVTSHDTAAAPRVSNAAAPATSGALPGAATSKSQPRTTVKAARTETPQKRVPQPLDPLQRILGDYPNLVARANGGDAAAAMQLYEGMRWCSQSPRTPASLDDFIQQAAVDFADNPDWYPGAVQLWTDTYEACNPFPQSQVDAWRHWLTLAAAAGNEQAKRAYIADGKPDDRRSDTYLKDTRDYVATARRYLDEEIDAGNVDALLLASANYGPAGNGIYDSNIRQEYTYLYAYCLARECHGVEVSRLTQLAAALRPSDLAAANARGEAIYRQCCAK